MIFRVNTNIAEYNQTYPEINSLSPDQKKSYKFIYSNIEKQNYVDVKENNSYIMLYLNELVKKLITEKNDLKYYEERINFIRQNYITDFLQVYSVLWLGDIYFFFGEYEKALLTWEQNLQPAKIMSMQAEKIISLKLQMNTPLTALEAISFKKKVTKYGYKNIDKVVIYLDNILKHDYENHLITNEYFTKNENAIKCPIILFSGCVYGFDINHVYKKKNPEKFTYSLTSLKKLIEYIDSICVQAENALREDNGIPRIGEGWISETELFYKIKEHYPQYKVLQHYHDTWLGNQHLDVYIKDINVGIEYQGAQHYKAIEIFGGEEGLINTQKRDKQKVAKCKKNNTKLVIVNEGYNFSDVIKEIEE